MTTRSRRETQKSERPTYKPATSGMRFLTFASVEMSKDITIGWYMKPRGNVYRTCAVPATGVATTTNQSSPNGESGVAGAGAAACGTETLPLNGKRSMFTSGRREPFLDLEDRGRVVVASLKRCGNRPNPISFRQRSFVETIVLDDHLCIVQI